MKKVAFLLIFLVVLSACSKKLDSPTNVRVEGDKLVWDEVKYATGYILKIGDNTYRLEDNFFIIKDLSTGNYKAIIKAVSDKYNESNEVSFDFDVSLPKLGEPSNIEVVDYYLKWSNVENADFYVVRFEKGDLIYIFDTESNRYDIDFLPNGNYVVKIVAHSNSNYVTSNEAIYNLVINKEKLNTPKNIKIDQKIISWDEVKKASSYKVIIDEEEFTVVDNYFNLSEYPNGSYNVQIKAISRGFIDSDPLEAIINIYDVVSDIPSNLLISDKKLTWDYIEGVTSYIVSINDVEYEVNNNEFDLSDLPLNYFYTIKVKVKDGLFSNEVVYETFVITDEVYKVTFNKNTTNNLEYELNSKFDLLKVYKEDEEIFKGYFDVEDRLVISKEYLVTLSYKMHYFDLYTSIGIIKLELTIIDDRKPYIISDSNIVFSGEDLILEFQLYDGRIVSVFGNNITTNDYVVDENKLIIKSEYINGIFVNESKNTLILGYHLSSNTHEVIGYIFIKRN